MGGKDEDAEPRSNSFQGRRWPQIYLSFLLVFDVAGGFRLFLMFTLQRNLPSRLCDTDPIISCYLGYGRADQTELPTHRRCWSASSTRPVRPHWRGRRDHSANYVGEAHTAWHVHRDAPVAAGLVYSFEEDSTAYECEDDDTSARKG